MRPDALGLFLSGLDERRYRIDGSLGQACTAAIKATLREGDRLELLAVTRDGYVDVVFTDPTERDSTATHSDDSVIDRLTAGLATTLPNWVGLKRGAYDLRPLGTAPLHTARVVRESASPAALGSVFADVIAANAQQARPTVCQLLLTRRRGDRFTAVLRVAEDRPQPAPIGRHVATNAVANQRGDGLSEVLPAGYCSSRELLTRHWTTRESPLRPTDDVAVLHAQSTARQSTEDGLKELSAASPAARRAMDVATTDREYHNLVAGQCDVEWYRPLDVEPTVRLSTAALESLLSVLPLYAGHTWPSERARSAPLLEATDTIREPVASSSRSRPSVNAAVPPSLGGWLSRWCEELTGHGTRIADRRRGDPHLRGGPHGKTAPIVIVDPTASATETAIETAGELIMAANRAVRAGSHLLVVTPSATAATWAGRVLAVPHAGVLESGETVVYTVPDPVIDATGGRLLVARDAMMPTWTVRAGTTRRLRCGDTCLASGALSTPLEALSYETPRLKPEGDALTVYHPDRSLEFYGSTSECLSTYQYVYRPVYPVWPTFRGHATVLFRDGSRLRSQHPATQWSHSPGFETDLETALSTFIETYTVSATGTGTKHCGAVLDAWLHDQLECQVPPLAPIGRRLPARIVPKTTDDDELIGLQGREWRIPAMDRSLAWAHGEADAA